jgi:hypothetical protein
METDLQFYTRSMVEALHAARSAATPEMRRAHERLAKTFAMQIYRLENSPTVRTSEPLRLRPLRLAA